MPKINYAQTNFTAGEVSPRIYGRFDISRDQAERIAERAITEADPEAAFVRIWENDAWWV